MQHFWHTGTCRYNHEPTRVSLADDSWKDDWTASGKSLPYSELIMWFLFRHPQAGVLTGKLQYGTAFGGSKVMSLRSCNVLFSSYRSGWRHEQNPNRKWIQLCGKRYAHKWYHWGTSWSICIFWAHLLPSADNHFLLLIARLLMWIMHFRNWVSYGFVSLCG